MQTTLFHTHVENLGILEDPSATLDNVAKFSSKDKGSLALQVELLTADLFDADISNNDDITLLSKKIVQIENSYRGRAGNLLKVLGYFHLSSTGLLKNRVDALKVALARRLISSPTNLWQRAQRMPVETQPLIKEVAAMALKTKYKSIEDLVKKNGTEDELRTLLLTGRYDSGLNDASAGSLLGFLTSTNYHTPMGLAARNGREDLVKVLLDADANPFLLSQEGRGPYGLNALSEAAWAGQLEVIKAIVEHPKHANKIREIVSSVPMAWAASRGHTAVVEYLLAKGYEPNDQRIHYFSAYGVDRYPTPIAVAIEGNYAETAGILAEKSAAEILGFRAKGDNLQILFKSPWKNPEKPDEVLIGDVITIGNEEILRAIAPHLSEAAAKSLISVLEPSPKLQKRYNVTVLPETPDSEL